MPWDVQRTAVMNEIFADQRLEPGQLVKIAISEHYRPARTPSLGSGSSGRATPAAHPAAPPPTAVRRP